MRYTRARGLVSVIAVMLMSLAGLTLSSGVGAQEGSPPAGAPPAGGFEIAPGVTAEALAFQPGQEEPSVYRLTFAPGVTYMVQENPALEIAYLESGSLTLQLSVPSVIGQLDAPDEAAMPTGADTDFTVEAGQYIVVPPFTTGEVRNEGTEPAVVTVAGVVPGGMATPGATPSS